MARRVRLISRGVADVLRSDSVRQALYDLLGPVEAEARASAPRKTGAHAASIHRESGIGRRRAWAAVVADSDHSLLVESRTGHMARSLKAAK